MGGRRPPIARPGLRARSPASGHCDTPGRTMALKAEGSALDCFEVTLKCEEGEDEEEAVVVAVIPRPEPMLRGEDGRRPHFRVMDSDPGLPSVPVRGPGTPSPPWVWGPVPHPPFGLGPGALLLRPHPGLESQALPNSPSPAPAQGLEPSIHSRRAPPSAPSPGPSPGGRILGDAGCPRPRSHPTEAGPGARLCCRPRGGKASKPEAERRSLVSGVSLKVEAAAPAKRILRASRA